MVIHCHHAYSFFGVEVLSRMIKRAQEQGKLTGFSLGHGHGYLGHLLYADDCLLFARASREEATAVSVVLKDYCKLSGQQVNKAKSQIIFGVDVHSRQSHRVKRTLKMVEAQCPIHYLCALWHEVPSLVNFSPAP